MRRKSFLTNACMKWKHSLTQMKMYKMCKKCGKEQTYDYVSKSVKMAMTPNATGYFHLNVTFHSFEN